MCLKKEPNDIQPYAYMRIFSESETIGVTLKTLLQGGVKRGIIGYNLDDNGKDDGTKEIILNFANKILVLHLLNILIMWFL